MKNELAGDIALAKGKTQYDTYCKRILANKIILAWILKYAPDYIGNAISFYNFQKCDVIPGIPKEAYDKISVVMICLNAKSEKGNRLTKMLGILLSLRLETQAKIHQLEHEFDIPMENDMGEELNQMCNLSDYVEELGIEKGIEKHLSQQVKKKLAKGRSVEEIADELEEDEATIRRILKNIE